MGRKGPPVRPWVVILFGIFCIGGGLLASLGIINPLISRTVQERLVVDDVTKPGFEQWETNTNKDDVSQIFQFYFWNLTNADKVRAGSNPVVEKIGPFFYERRWRKFDVEIEGEWNKYLYWVNYQPVERSKALKLSATLPLDPATTRITGINFAFMGVLAITGNDANIVIPLTGPLLKRNINVLAGYVLAFNTPQTVADQYDRILQILPSADAFAAEWANGTYADDPLWESFLPSVLAGKPTGISSQSVQLLFDSSLPAALTLDNFANYDPLYSWFRFTNDDKKALAQRFLLTDEQVSLVQKWLVNYQQVRVWPRLRKRLSATEPIQEIIDLGYLQYGKAGLLGGNLSNTVFPSEKLNGAMEYFNAQTPPAAALPLATARYFLNDPKVGIFNPDPFTYYAQLCNTGNFNMIKAIYGLNDAQAQLHANFIFSPANQLNSVIARFTTPYLGQLYREGGDLFTTHTVTEWLFGYNDPLLAQLRPARNPILIFNSWETEDECRSFYTLPDGTRNFTVANNGGKDFRKFNEFLQVDGVKETNFWPNPEKVRGTDGVQFSPDLGRNDKHTVWFPEYGRAVDMESSYRSYTVKDIKVNRYILPDTLFSANLQYQQTIPGFINLTERYQRTPIFASQPYMYGSESKYTSKISGQNPLEGKNLGTFVDVEPVTGATLRGRRQLQLNIYLRSGNPNPLFSPSGPNRLVPVDAFYPAVYIDGGSEVSDARAKELNDTLFRALSLSRGLLIALTTFGSILVFVASVYWGYKKYRMKGSYDSF